MYRWWWCIGKRNFKVKILNESGEWKRGKCWEGGGWIGDRKRNEHTYTNVYIFIQIMPPCAHSLLSALLISPHLLVIYPPFSSSSSCLIYICKHVHVSIHVHTNILKSTVYIIHTPLLIRSEKTPLHRYHLTCRLYPSISL